jgi:hypothetical protein
MIAWPNRWRLNVWLMVSTTPALPMTMASQYAGPLSLSRPPSSGRELDLRRVRAIGHVPVPSLARAAMRLDSFVGASLTLDTVLANVGLKNKSNTTQHRRGNAMFKRRKVLLGSTH